MNRPDASWRLAVHEELASTQDIVLAAAAAGEPAGLAVLARRQSAGRGTQGRAWNSSEGNLHLSLLLRPEGPLRGVPHWSLLAAVALAETLAAHLPEPTALRLKWPNDLLLDGAKCAGILTQAAPDGAGGIGWVVVGMGVNLRHAPHLGDRATTSLAARGGAVPEPVPFSWELLGGLDLWRARYAAEGFAPVRRAWMARGPRPGSAVRLRQAGRLVEGRYAGLDGEGRLLLEREEGPLAVSSGEIEAQDPSPVRNP